MLAASYMPKTAVVNNAYTATATLRNINAKEEAADSYTASLYFDGEVVATAPAQAIAGGADAVLLRLTSSLRTLPTTTL